MNPATDDERDLTRGSIYKHLIRIGIPAALGMVLTPYLTSLIIGLQAKMTKLD